MNQQDIEEAKHASNVLLNGMIKGDEIHISMDTDEPQPENQDRGYIDMCTLIQASQASNRENNSNHPCDCLALSESGGYSFTVLPFESGTSLSSSDQEPALLSYYQSEVTYNHVHRMMIIVFITEWTGLRRNNEFKWYKWTYLYD